MLVLNPDRVRFEDEELAGVRTIVLERSAGSVIEDWSDRGPYASFVDVPEQRVVVRLNAEGRESGAVGPLPGAEGDLEFYTARVAGISGRRRVRVRCVVVRSGHEIGAGGTARRVLEFRGVSSDGATDPVLVSLVEAGVF